MGHSVSFYGNIDHFDAVKVHWVGEIYPTSPTGCFFGSFLYIRVLIFRYIYLVKKYEVRYLGLWYESDHRYVETSMTRRMLEKYKFKINRNINTHPSTQSPYTLVLLFTLYENVIIKLKESYTIHACGQLFYRRKKTEVENMNPLYICGLLNACDSPVHEAFMRI